MPTYRVRCQEHGDLDAWAPMTEGAPKFCPHCDFPVVQVITPPTITQRSDTEALRLAEKEKQWDTDGEAYVRLRANGIQPRTIDGSAEFEQRADSPLEFKLGKIIDNRELKEAAMQYNDHYETPVEV